MLTTDLIRSPLPESRKLMIVLHGLGDSMEGYRWLPPALNLPWLNYLLVNAPDEYYGGFSWYDISGNASPGIERSKKALYELLQKLVQDGYRTEEIILFGFSQGCLMTIETGLTYPATFAGLIGISGYINDLFGLLKNLSPYAREQRILVTHGTLDNLVPFAEAKRQFLKLKESGIHLEWKEFTKDHTIAGLEEINLIRDFVKERFAQVSP